MVQADLTCDSDLCTESCGPGPPKQPSSSADGVIPLLRSTSPPRVWLLAHAAPVTKSMHAFHWPAYLTVPRWPLVRELPGVEVGIVSGRLYFPYAEYGPLLVWLGR